MINALFLTLLMVGTAGQSIAQKNYNAKFKGRGVISFMSLSTLSACIFFFVSNGFKLDFTMGLLPYSAGFAVCGAITGIFGFYAICTGPLSLTSLITSCSLIIPTLYGLIFLDESVSSFFWIGLALLAVSLVLINAPSKERKISLKWIIFVSLTFVGNGTCAILQTMQQRAFGGTHGNDMMVGALFIESILIFSVALIADRKAMPTCIKGGAHYMAISGVSNGLANFMLLLLLPRMLAAILFPIISAGQIITSWAVSRFIFKEKLSIAQNVALVLGTAAIVFMNL